jgi:hypothetical protein
LSDCAGKKPEPQDGEQQHGRRVSHLGAQSRSHNV